MNKNKVPVKIWALAWAGDMGEKTIHVDPYPTDLLTVDDWFVPDKGELCFNIEGKLDIVIGIKFRRSDGTFKAGYMYQTKNHEGWVSEGLVHRVYVKKGKEFEFEGKIYKYRKPAVEENENYLKQYH